MLDFEDYGVILYSGYGDDPSKDITDKIMSDYGIDFSVSMPSVLLALLQTTYEESAAQRREEISNRKTDFFRNNHRLPDGISSNNTGLTIQKDPVFVEADIFLSSVNRSLEKNQSAATCIQRFFRGYLTRKNLNVGSKIGVVKV
ncbi:MAG: hypothetical protein LRY69_00345 [Gammaproteobacteria bacterium]|nr:hypothetical protein [Gammaproteobacteria bacterium]